MFGPEGRPQHCCAWLGVASSFPECASPIDPEEVEKSQILLHAGFRKNEKNVFPKSNFFLYEDDMAKSCMHILLFY